MYLFSQSDAVRLPLPDRSMDLVFGSPPYLDCRTYGINAQRDCQPWIDWMLEVTTEACRVSKGLVLWVVAGAVRQHCYQPGPEGLLYEWWKRGGMAWRPCYWYRSGIPGSGRQHWFRADVEYVLAFVGPDRRPRRGRPATHTSAVRDFGSGSASTHGVGGRVVPRKNQVSKTLQSDDAGEPDPNDPNVFWTDNTAMGHPPKWAPGGEMTNRQSDGTRGSMETQGYHPSVLANPGNLIKTNCGYGSMGSLHAHDNEAPFPEALAEFFIRTACPPGGIVLDPFSGSGTTVAVAERLGRVGLGFDIRRSQCELGVRRITRPHSQRKRTWRTGESLPLFGDSCGDGVAEDGA